MKTLNKKSLPTSLCQREERFPSIKRGLKGVFPSLAKRGEGRFYKINVILLLYLVTLTAALFVCVLHAEALDVGDSVPDFHIVTIDGKEISYEKDLKGKKPVYLIFWATW